MAAAQAILTGLVFVLAIRRGEGGVSTGERFMIAIAGGGVVGWIIADEPIVATVCVVAADLIGAALMIPKTYRDPDSETLATFALASLGGLLAAGAVGTLDLSLLLYPLYFAPGQRRARDPHPPSASGGAGDNRRVVRRISSPVFVGRTEQLEALDAALAAARGGEASAVLVSGEAGIGKTRLLTEFAARASAGGARVLIGNCIELGDGELPHAPLAAILRQLERELGPDESSPPCSGPRARSWTRRRRTARRGRLELVLAMLGRLGELAPAVIAIEDLHWADRSTRDLLAYLIRSLRRGADRARGDLPQRRAAPAPPPARVPHRPRRRRRADRAGALRRRRARRGS